MMNCIVLKGELTFFGGFTAVLTGDSDIDWTRSVEKSGENILRVARLAGGFGRTRYRRVHDRSRSCIGRQGGGDGSRD